MDSLKGGRIVKAVGLQQHEEGEEYVAVTSSSRSEDPSSIVQSLERETGCRTIWIGTSGSGERLSKTVDKTLTLLLQVRCICIAWEKEKEVSDLPLCEQVGEKELYAMRCIKSQDGCVCLSSPCATRLVSVIEIAQRRVKENHGALHSQLFIRGLDVREQVSSERVFAGVISCKVTPRRQSYAFVSTQADATRDSDRRRALHFFALLAIAKAPTE